MNDMMSGRDVLDYLAVIARDLRAEKAQLEEERASHPKRKETVSADEESAWEHLLAVLLPSHAPHVLDAAAARLGLPTIAAQATGVAREARRQQLQAQLDACAADPEFKNREAILNEISIRTPGLEEMIAPLRADIGQLPYDTAWQELFRQGYATPDYKYRWYHWTYYRHWKMGDEVVEKHGPRMHVKDFAALRSRFVSEDEALRSLVGELAGLQRRQANVEALVQKHNDANAGLANLDKWLLDRARTLVRDHLSAVPLTDVMPLLGSDPALSLAIKRVHGIRAKVGYLDSVEQEWIEKPLEDVLRRLSKVESAMQKFQRPKHFHGRYPRAEIEAKYGLPSEKWRQRWDRYQTTTQEIIVFDNYSVVDPMVQFLWWDQMVHCHHGNFIPDVGEYHRHYSSHHETYTDVAGNDDFSTRDAS
jgi:hypothetical protein